jgi:chemotaxis protein methyltransferase CheR
VFENLAHGLLPELARAAIGRGRRVLRAWSAGCASGEEPYSLRLVWDLTVAPSLPDAEFHILATDASPALLARARRGVYTRSALRELPPAWASTAFETLDAGYRLREGFRSGVEFCQQDLRVAMPAGPFDLILCRNLAFTYFGLRLQRAARDGLVRRLVAGGALLVGSHEALPEPLIGVRFAGRPGLYRAPTETSRASDSSGV